MNRVQKEKNYWNIAAVDPDVDNKYICDLSDKECFKALGKLEGRVLDLGCGVGRLMKPGFYGIDISEKMIALAKNRKPGCHFQVNDGRDIPFPDDYFDTVYCVLVFQHLPLVAVANYIIETARVLKNGGKFIFQYIDGEEDEPFSKHHDIENLMKVLTGNGFVVDTIDVGKVHDDWNWVKATKGEIEALSKSTSEGKR